jgi:hypothetical protein
MHEVEELVSCLKSHVHKTQEGLKTVNMLGTARDVFETFHCKRELLKMQICQVLTEK